MLLACTVFLALLATALADSFDYIVVGGGTSGIPLAVRLAERYRVALIEAGTYYEKSYVLAKTPGADVLPVGSDPNKNYDFKADWGIVTAPQPSINGRRVHFARGKCLGGSSAQNFMIYQRPTRQSLDRWAEAVNDSSYSFDEVWPYYQRSPRLTPPNVDRRLANATTLYNASAFNPSGGPLDVSYSNFVMPFSTWMGQGMEAIGLPEASDFNSGKLFGYQYCTSTIRPKDQSRSSSESSFLRESDTPNLRVYTNTLAKRILFDEEKNAIGVEISGSRQLTANKEVIVSAGVFQSPQLLMVSGLGPIEHLQEFNITVLSDLPGVGQGMLDHPFFAPSYRVGLETLTRVATHPLHLASEYLRWATKSEGIFASPVADFLGWEKIPEEFRGAFSEGTRQNLSRFTEDWPEVEYISGAGYIGNASNLLLDQPNDGHEYASMLGVLITSTSHGTVTLASADISDLPIINPNWLDTESDGQLAIALFKRIRQAFGSNQMDPIVIGEEYNPGPEVQTDDEILDWIRNNLMTLWHPSRTCKMGTVNDLMAVVDSKARVFGVNRLRVVDASAFPFLPPGHPQSTCYMLAEKIAVDILDGDGDI